MHGTLDPNSVRGRNSPQSGEHLSIMRRAGLGCVRAAQPQRASPDESTSDVSGARTLQDLAGVLRALRRRHARRHRDGELTYRELATRTGWSTTAIAEYLTGKTLPPTDRFDVLTGLLGATRSSRGSWVLAELLRADGGVVSAEQLLEKAWDEHADPFTGVVRFTIMMVRRKLGDPPVIETVAGAGYRIP